MRPGPKPRPVAERFWEKVDKSGECWTWRPVTGRHPFGYGMFTPQHGQRVTSHRFSWQLAHGPIPSGLFVLHKCDNPPCVRPDHLFLGTHKDNMADMKAKKRQPGRTNWVRGPGGRFVA
jgi:hypothetical protein